MTKTLIVCYLTMYVATLKPLFRFVLDDISLGGAYTVDSEDVWWAACITAVYALFGPFLVVAWIVKKIAGPLVQQTVNKHNGGQA